MELEQSVMNNVGDHLTALTGLSTTLLGLLKAEAEALATMKVAEIERITEEKKQILEAIATSDTQLKTVLKNAAESLNLPEDHILKRGPLALEYNKVIANLRDLQTQVDRANQAVQIRANYGLHFFQSLRGTSVGYGAGGETLDVGPSKAHFHQVM